MSNRIDPENVLSLADSMAAPARAVPAPVSPAGKVDASLEAVDRLKALDAAAWQDLFDRHFKKMYAFAYARTGDPQAAEDIASEVFAAAAKGIKTYKPTGAPLAAWLYRIARNITADHLDARRRKPSVSVEELEIEVEAEGWDGLVDLRGDLRQAMTHLTKEQQEVIALRFFDDCSLAETAAAMHKSVDAIKVLQHRALGALRRAMTPKERSS
jgi:RNA polymerase sigma-70 factor (ECF subfamily)